MLLNILFSDALIILSKYQRILLIKSLKPIVPFKRRTIDFNIFLKLFRGFILYTFLIASRKNITVPDISINLLEI